MDGADAGVLLAAVTSTVLCARGWHRHFSGRMGFDGGATHGMHLTMGTTFTPAIWVVAASWLARR